jgi:hypothetical protein
MILSCKLFFLTAMFIQKYLSTVHDVISSKYFPLEKSLKMICL